MNTNGDGKAGDPFWENAERMLYTALIALLRDWFPPEDYNLSGLLTLLSLAEAREDDENFKSPLDLLFLQIEDGKKYVRKQGAAAPAAASGPTGLTRTLRPRATGRGSRAGSGRPSRVRTAGPSWTRRASPSSWNPPRPGACPRTRTSPS